VCEISDSHGSEYEVQSSGMYCCVLNWMSTDAPLKCLLTSN